MPATGAQQCATCSTPLTPEDLAHQHRQCAACRERRESWWTRPMTWDEFSQTARRRFRRGDPSFPGAAHFPTSDELL